MNVPVSLAAVALSLLLASAVKAQTYGGTVTFSGAVVIPTCLATERVVTGMARHIASAHDGEEEAGNCLVNPGGERPQVVPFKSQVRLLGPDETDSLLRYFEKRTSGAGSKLITVTYL
jgi:type 1 fimbria pilin